MIIHGYSEEELKKLPDNSVGLIITSPPYANRRKNTYGGISEDQPVDVKLLRSIDEICKEYDGVGIEPDYMDDSNIESVEICQLNKYPDGSYSVGYFNERGNGTGYYTIRGNRKFVENYDFVFI
jgi:DNA modification methylase